MDSLFGVIVFLVISAAAAWLKRRQGGGEEESGTESPTAPPRSIPGAPPAGNPRPTPASSWEEELRRLLEGQTSTLPPRPAPPPVRPPAPPPIQPQRLPSTPRPAPPPLPSKPAVRSAPRIPMPVVDESSDIPATRLATLTEASAALQRASRLHEGVANHLEQIDAQTERHLVKTPTSRRRSVSPDVAQAVSLTRSPRSARQAVVAALILGPPKALES